MFYMRGSSRFSWYREQDLCQPQASQELLAQRVLFYGMENLAMETGPLSYQKSRSIRKRGRNEACYSAKDRSKPHVRC